MSAEHGPPASLKNARRRTYSEAMSAAARALERLYAVAPRDFTRARNALAAELRESRDADAARAIARLRRPSAPLWAVNQLSLHARPALERFLVAVGRQRRTQLDRKSVV